MGTKVSDMQCVSVCPRHHAEIHNQGRTTFMERYQLNDANIEHAIEFYNKKWEDHREQTKIR